MHVSMHDYFWILQEYITYGVVLELNILGFLGVTITYSRMKDLEIFSLEDGGNIV